MVSLQRYVIFLILINTFSISYAHGKMTVSASETDQGIELALQKLLAGISQKKDQFNHNQIALEEFIEKGALPLWDIKVMARTAVGKSAWNTASKEERESLQQALRNTLLRYFVLAFKFYNGQQLEFIGKQKVKEGRLLWLRSVISGQSMPKLSLDYQLRKRSDGQWLIVDVRLAGVSLMRSKRDEFKKVIEQEGFQALLTSLEQKNRKVLSSKYHASPLPSSRDKSPKQG